MWRYFNIAFLLLALLTGGTARADNSRDSDLIVVPGSGLACFSIQPPDAPTNGPAGPRRPPQPASTYRSCDQLCADKHAACTATTSTMNPPLSCASVGYVPGSTLCRCCAVER